MTATQRLVAACGLSQLENVENVENAARLVHDAETALHAARQSHVDAWIAAAADQLHAALANYLEAVDTNRAIIRGPQPPTNSSTGVRAIS
jgi:hypothetical protein